MIIACVLFVGWLNMAPKKRARIGEGSSEVRTTFDKHHFLTRDCEANFFDYYQTLEVIPQ